MLGKKDTPSKVKLREEDGGGYIASLEVTHQLHCLVNEKKLRYYQLPDLLT
jgi:Mycotoxin biosynthesis protein UstYa